MSTGYQIKDQTALYYLTIQVVDWIDIFTRQIYRDIVLDSLRYCQLNKELQVVNSKFNFTNFSQFDFTTFLLLFFINYNLFSLFIILKAELFF